jgi:phosphopantothenate synthetase
MTFSEKATQCAIKMTEKYTYEQTENAMRNAFKCHVTTLHLSRTPTLSMNASVAECF